MNPFLKKFVDILLLRHSCHTLDSVFVLIRFFLFTVIIIPISTKYKTTSIRCSTSKIKSLRMDDVYVTSECSLEYLDKFDLTLPIDVMFTLNFGIVYVLNIFYAIFVSSRVKKFDILYTTRTESSDDAGEENRASLLAPSTDQNPLESRKCLKHFSTFHIHIFYLIVLRLIPLLVFAYISFQSHLPYNYSCTWQPEIQQKGTSRFYNTLNLQSNSALKINCTNGNSKGNNALIYIVASVDVCFATVTIGELVYIACSIFTDKDFTTDQEFCTVYLLRKRKRIRKLVNNIRDKFIDSQVFQLRDDFGGDNISSRSLDEIYVNVVIQEGRERLGAYPRKFGRHEIYQSHLETPSTVTKLESIADIFKPKKGEQNQTYPRTILVIGRPGIGKTMLTRKLLHQWKEQEDEFWLRKIVILLSFRSFNNNKTVSFREMLCYGRGFSSEHIEIVYNFVLSNPTKTVLIFDGLDELTVDSNSPSINSDEAVIILNRRMPVFLIFKMLVSGRFLRGVTVLTTSRPSVQNRFQVQFEKTVEVLGFFKEQIKEYVDSFCDNINTSELVWNKIEGSAELLNLCYIPVNSYIVCLTLKESIENDENIPEEQFSNGLKKKIPRTLTEIYKKARQVLLYRHSKLKFEVPPSNYLICTSFPEGYGLKEDFEKLKKVARDRIIEEEFIFEPTSDDGFSGDLENCGFFHKLPDKQQNLFCFLHLTLQEFLAASKEVDDMENVEQFLVTHVDDPKWHLVIQFVAGLVGDRFREAKKMSKESKEITFAVDIQKRFEDWASLLGTGGGDNKIALLGIKCLYELQEIKDSNKCLTEANGELRLDDLNIAAVDSTALFKFLGNCKNLKRLIFHHSQIQGKYTYHNFEKLLFSNAANTIYSFSWIGVLTNEGIKYLSNALIGKYCKLDELVLGDDKITNQAVKSLSYSIQNEKCKLTKLVITSKDITDQGIEYLNGALKSSNCKLTKLHLNNTRIGDEGVQWLCDAIKSGSCKLTELSLNGSLKTPRGVKGLCDVVTSNNCKLANLYLDNNKIDNQGVKYLRDVWKFKKCELTELGLNNNKITDEGVKYLSEFCESKNYDSCILCLSGMEYLSRGNCSSKKCKCLKVYLDGNKITDQGVKYFVTDVSGDCELIQPDLNGENRTTDV